MSKQRKFSLGAIALNAMEEAQVPAVQQVAEPEATSAVQPEPAMTETPQPQPEPVQAAPVTVPFRAPPSKRSTAAGTRQKLSAPASPAGKGTIRDRARQLSVYLEDPVYEQVREIAHTERVKMHQLILEGVDLMLKKRGYASIKELIAKAG